MKEKTLSAYLIGIKGVGMSALALYLKKAGYAVTGSDVADNFVTDKILADNGIEILSGYDGKNLKGLKPSMVIASAVHGKENPEIKEAQKRHLNFMYYSEALGQITNNKKVIAVSGTHGKTTITALTAYIMEKGNLSPSYIIGAGQVSSLKTNASKGDSEYFVLEADEYRKSPEDLSPKFLDINPEIAIVSSIELDHPDVYPTIEAMYDAFYRLVCRVPRKGFIVLCTDYPKSLKLLRTLVDRKFETYGFNLQAKWRIMDLKEDTTGSTFSLQTPEGNYGPFTIKLPGKYNVLNATATIITCLKLDIDEKTIKKYLPQFRGVKRRYEKILETNDLVIIDDYAHHPTSVENVLEATKTQYPNYQLWCIFQAHTSSRTQKFLDKFAKAFAVADQTIITDIYTSAREVDNRITGQELANEIKRYQKKVIYIKDWEKIKEYIFDTIKKPAVILTIGAGDIYKLALMLKEEINK